MFSSVFSQNHQINVRIFAVGITAHAAAEHNVGCGQIDENIRRVIVHKLGNVEQGLADFREHPLFSVKYFRAQTVVDF